MATEILMPKLGLTMTEGLIQKWLVQVGDTVTSGQPLLEISSEKLTSEVESPASGVVLDIVHGEGATVKCKEVVGWVGQEGENVGTQEVPAQDEETVLNSVKKTGRLIIVDEANPHNNTATDIASVVSDKAFDYLDGPVKCVCAPNTPVPFATNLEQAYIPDADKVLKVADELIQDLKG